MRRLRRTSRCETRDRADVPSTDVTQGKDTSKYNQSLAQALDSIRARSAYVEVSAQHWADCAGLTSCLALDDGRRGMGRVVGPDYVSGRVVVASSLLCRVLSENASL